MHTDSKARRLPLGKFVPAVLLAAAIPFAVFAQEDENMKLTVQSAAESSAPSAASAPAPSQEPMSAASLAGAPDADPSAKTEAKKRVSTWGLWDEKEVSTPEAAEGKTLEAAMEEIAAAAGKSLVIYPEGSVLPCLTNTYVRPRNAGDEEEYAKLFRLLLAPYEDVDIYIDMEEDSNRVYVGLADEIDRRRTEYDVRKLARNHMRISIVLKDVTLYDAVLRIADLSKANILTSYMEPDDQVTEVGKEEEAPPSDASKIATPVADDKASKARRVTYSTQGDAEWRTVLRSVLEPDYAFDERDGMVRVATKERFRKMAEAERNAVRMEMRYVPVRHANPEDIVAKLNALKVKENQDAVIQVAPFVEKGGSPVNSFRHNLSSSSSSLSTGNTKIGDSGSASSGSWGNLKRPKNPPAVLLYDNPGNLDRLEALVKSLDVREKQVLIEALILDLGDRGARQIGMEIESMGFGSIQLLGLHWSQTHETSHASDNEGSWTGGTTGGTYDYRGKGRGTTATQAGKTSVVEKNDIFGKPTRTTETVESVNTGIAPSWAYGTVSEAFAGRTTGFDNGYDKTSSSVRNRGWSTILGPLDFNFILDLVETDGDSKVLSSPVLTIGDHCEAMVHVGDVHPVAQLETTIVAGGVNTAVAENVEWYELVTGIMMWVGPEVTEDGGSVRLWIHPKLTQQTGETSISVGGNTLSYPELSSQEIDTRVTVPSGGTLLLGGLIQTSTIEELKKVPFLGDIPLLGRLFRWSSTSSVRRNLVIMVRPTVLDDENPSTGFEEPANRIIEPMMQGSGRTLEDVVMSDGDDPMKRREKAILEAVGLKKKDDSSASAEADAEESEGTKEEATATESEDGNPESAGADAKTEEPSVSIVVTPSADGDETPPPAATDSNATADDLTTN